MADETLNGKTIAGLEHRQGPLGKDKALVLKFSDGSELVFIENSGPGFTDWDNWPEARLMQGDRILAVWRVR